MSGCYRTFILEKSSNSYPTHKHSRHATMWTHYIYSNGQESKPQEMLFSNRYNWVKKKELQSPLYTCCDRFFLLASKVSCNRMWAACRQGGQPDSQPVNRNYLRRVMMRWVRNGQRRVEKRSQQSISAKLQVWTYGQGPDAQWRKALLHPARHFNVPTDDTEACVTLPLRYCSHLFSTDIALKHDSSVGRWSCVMR